MLGRWKRSSFFIALAGVVVVAFGGATTTAGAKVDTAQADTFTIMGFGPGDEIANVRADTATDVLKQRYGADVSNPAGGFDDQKFLAALAARNVPDIVYMDRKKVPEYAARGAIVPLSSCINNENIPMAQYRLASKNAVTYKKRIYGIPEFTNPVTIIAVDSVLQSAGVTPAQLNTANWSKLRAAAKKMVQIQDGKVTRIGFDPKLPEHFPLWTKALGANLISPNGLRAQLNSRQAIKALTYTLQLIKDQGGWDRFKAFRDTWDFFGTQNQVDQKQVGAWPMESFYYAVMARTTPNTNITAIPFRATNGKPLTLLTGNAWVIPRGSAHPGMACAWAKTMTQPDTWLKAVKVRFDNQRRLGRPFTGTFTANRVADIRIFEDLYQSFGKKAYDDAVHLLIDVQKAGFEWPSSVAGGAVYQAMQDAVNRVLSGKQSVVKALNQAQKEAQTAINKNK
jgi:multiple sugar transport system substrate-binding protein